VVRISRIAVSIFVLTLVFNTSLSAQCTRWERIEAMGPTSQDWYTAVAWGGGEFLVADTQEFYSSPDGRTWNRASCTMGADECLIGRRTDAVVWNGTEFIAMGNSGHDRVYRIADSRLEIAGDCEGGWYRGLAFNGSRYVAVGDNSIATSENASVWIRQATTNVECPCSVELARMTSVAWTGSQWIAVGHVSCGGVVLTSPDGTTWDVRAGEGEHLQSVATNGFLTVAVGDASIITSDGVSWDAVPGLPAGMRTVAWAGSEWVAVGTGGTIYSSLDGVEWIVAGSANGCIDEIAASEDTVLAVGLQTMARFDSQLGWTDLYRRVPEAAAVIWDDRRFLASGRSRVHESIDGRDWRRLECAGVQGIDDVGWDGAMYLGVGTVYPGFAGRKTPVAQASQDGVMWTELELPSAVFAEPRGFRAVAPGDAGFLVIGDDVVLTTRDGSEWQVFPFGYDATDVVWDGARFVALAAAGALLSSDGASWEGPYEIWDLATEDLPYHQPRIASNAGTYVAIRPDGAMAVSRDAVAWTVSTVDPSGPVADVVWTGDDWVAVTMDEEVLVSRDGASWRREPVPWDASSFDPSGGSPLPNRFRLGVGGGRVVAMSDGVLLIRDCTLPSPRRSGRRMP
jgi:hypothetical protein